MSVADDQDDYDPDADPEMLQPQRLRPQPDQAEGADDPAETGETGPDRLSARTTGEVFDDHLRLAQVRDVDTDLERNYAHDCVILTGRGVYHGHDGVRSLADALAAELPEGRWHYRLRLVEGTMAYLEWSADAGAAAVEDGADSFLIVDGKIATQTIHYTVRAPDGRIVIGPDGRRR
ncbi:MULTISPECIES: nuclear transport factor 2 family protein [Nocardia]|uniref:nuclear transport factor 2 family protein n=1 Tax=Nocardia TaxID=1817 RepID=UPI001E332392|nr:MULTISPECIES: nuclear transport factor 2 family protein [Nocardia]